ncbi:MAG: TldD/PmbA family protein [Euryarchaeota archaeon]|nr:TldD/PmbA family protein [Euryarchaeota archaeon]
MRRKIEKGIEQSERLKADYCEIRAEEIDLTYISLADGRIDTLNQRKECGTAIRVLKNGAWGSVSCNIDDINEGVKDAISLAKKSAEKRKGKIKLAEVRPVQDTVRNKVKKPPNTVPVEKKIERMVGLYNKFKDYNSKIKAVSISYRDGQGKKHLFTNEGTEIVEDISYVWNFCWITGKKDQQLTSARNEIGSVSQGFEYFDEVSNTEIVEKTGKRVMMQLEGKNVKGGSFECVLGPRVVGVLAHEALGHLSEADLTVNSSFAGKVGEVIANEKPRITMVDGPVPNGFGNYTYDDEGVRAQRVEIIKNSVLSGLLTNREYAKRTGMPLVGAARAESWRCSPLIRMRNTYFEKGDFEEDELFEGIDHGYYCTDLRGGQAELNSSFQVGIQEGYEIVDGEIGDPIKNTSISGMATEALKYISGVGKKVEFESGRCGKGQEVFVSSGGPKMRFKKGAIVFG